jgi:energy-coupling factor transport system ATP-binding protein
MLDSTSAFEFVAHLAGLARSGKTIVVCEHRREYLAELPGLRTVTLCPEAPLPTGELALETAWRMGEVAPFTLELDALTVARGERTVLSGLSLALEGGQIVALVGPNGVGKTTLLRALAGVQPFSGQIFVRQAGQAVAPSLGMVFQNPDLQFFNPSVSAEILYRLPDPDLELYAGLLDALDLKRYQQTPPLLLSEGEKRRLALAVALARRPAHGVLLDEPSLGQDARHKAILLRTLKRVAASGRLVIMATHDLELAAHADRLVLLSPGEFLADGLAPGVLQDDLAWRRLGLRVPEWVRRAV